MGILDIPALTIWGVLGGWWQMHGDEFCSNPRLFSFIAGTIALGFYIKIIYLLPMLLLWKLYNSRGFMHALNYTGLIIKSNILGYCRLNCRVAILVASQLVKVAGKKLEFGADILAYVACHS